MFGVRATLVGARAYAIPQHAPSLAAIYQAGYSSVGRASDCRLLQISDGPWFDSGWPDFCLNSARGEAHEQKRPA